MLLVHNSLIVDARKQRLVFLPHDGNYEQIVRNERRGISYLRTEEADPNGSVKTVVRKGSIAYQKGVRTGDYLISVNGVPITDFCTYVTLSHKEKVKRSVFRSPDGAEKEIEW